MGPEIEVLLYEFKADLNAYLARVGRAVPAHSLAEVIAFNEKHRDTEMPYFGQETMLKAEKKGPLTEKAYLDALETCRRLSRAEGIDAACEKHRLDALVAPTAGPGWLTDWINGDHGMGDCSTPAGGGRLPAHHRAGWATSTACRWASPSSAPPGASPCC